jgi:hypothetical protein
MLTRTLNALFVWSVLWFLPPALADTLIYVSSDGPGIAFPEQSPLVPLGPRGTRGQLNVFVQTTEPLSGISLDATLSGELVRFTGADVLGINDDLSPNRWIVGNDGNVTDESVVSMEGFALLGLAGEGVGPGTENEPAFNPISGFLFATLEYEVISNNEGASALFLAIGENAIGSSYVTPIELGFGDLVPNVPGASGAYLDAILAKMDVPAPLGGDFNFDDSVDASDYTVWRDDLGSSQLAADGNYDGQVTSDDYDYWKARFGAIPFNGEFSTAIPEPSAFGLVAIGVALSIIAFRKDRAT